MRRLFSLLREMLDVAEDIYNDPAVPPSAKPESKSEPSAPAPDQPPLLVGVTECARLIGLSKATVWNLIAEGRLETIKVRNRRLVPYESLERFTKKQKP